MRPRIVPADPLSRGLIKRPEVRKACISANPAASAALDKVVASAHGCWVLKNRPQRDGYAMLRTGGRQKRMAHIVIWELLVGPVPPGLQLDHLCRNKRCVNPEHLEPVTPTENGLRGLNGVRMEVCPAGHEISGENAYYARSRNQYRCKTCYFADNKRRKKVRVSCSVCGRGLANGSVRRHLRESCPTADPPTFDATYAVELMRGGFPDTASAYVRTEYGGGA